MVVTQYHIEVSTNGGTFKSSSILDWDFPWNQPSIFGVPPFMETRNNAIYEKPLFLMVIELDVMNQYDIAY